MPGKAKENPQLTQAEEIAHKKAVCISVYEVTGVKKAAAAAARRTLTRVLEWEREDEEFRLDMLGAEQRFLMKNRHKVKLDNVFANLFDEYKPPRQEIETTMIATVTFNYVQPHDQHPPDPDTTPRLDVPERPDHD